MERAARTPAAAERLRERVAAPTFSALRLLARITKHFDKDFSLTDLFRSPTLEQMVQVIRGRPRRDRPDRDAGSGERILHGDAGEIHAWLQVLG